jgi:hypothetical protein
MDMACKFRIRMGLALPERVALLRQLIYTHRVRAMGREHVVITSGLAPAAMSSLSLDVVQKIM